jgi:hypothetical protein
VTVILVFLLKSQPPAGTGADPAAQSAGQGGAPGALPDLSTMTPRDQFDRLYNRVMQASEQGDTATANRFSPMALQAYTNLPEVDQDARYHAAMIRLHGGDIPGAQALADTIGTLQKGHLFGFVLNAAIARFGQDERKLQQNYAGYLGALDVEMKAGRPEYQDHKTMLDNFTTTARTATGKPN